MGEKKDEKVVVAGHTIDIRVTGGQEELWIDGARHRFSHSEDGYTLDADSYAPPQPTLLKVAKSYVERQLDKKN